MLLTIFSPKLFMKHASQGKGIHLTMFCQATTEAPQAELKQTPWQGLMGVPGEAS